MCLIYIYIYIYIYSHLPVSDHLHTRGAEDALVEVIVVIVIIVKVVIVVVIVVALVVVLVVIVVIIAIRPFALSLGDLVFRESSVPVDAQVCVSGEATAIWSFRHCKPASHLHRRLHWSQ